MSGPTGRGNGIAWENHELGYYRGEDDSHVGQAFRPDFPIMSGRKA